VPQENLVGPRGEGFVLAQERLGPGRIHHVTRWLGIAERAFDLLCEHVVERQIAPGETLADREVIQTWIAESRAEIEAARWLTLSTAWTVETEGWRAARRPISMIKFVVADTMLRVVDRAIQAHGGLGVTDDTVLAFFYRQERAARIYDGPDEVHKLWLGRSILADYRTGD
ncbi:MAG: acyl-CoA dehydrogenase family protein, partial [Thermoanaerobaculia bacterium]|nr:acyl-CoA dehydrogenase family protein [Thermoanaerobaculia bacterium]